MAKKSKARREIEDLVGAYGDAVTAATTRWAFTVGGRRDLGFVTQLHSIAAVFSHYENLLKRPKFAAHVAFPRASGRRQRRGTLVCAEILKFRAANRCCCSACITTATAALTKWRFAQRRFSFMFQGALRRTRNDTSAGRRQRAVRITQSKAAAFYLQRRRFAEDSGGRGPLQSCRGVANVSRRRA